MVVDRQGDGCNLNEFFIDNIDIKIDFESKRIHRSEYDEILPDPDGYIKKKKMKS